MAASRSYLEYILDSLSGLDDITHRAMMGEYIIYYRGKIAAYICDDRLLVKTVAAAERLLPNAPRELPYEGAKPMYLVDNTDDKDYLKGLVEAMYEQLPSPRTKKK